MGRSAYWQVLLIGKDDLSYFDRDLNMVMRGMKIIGPMLLVGNLDTLAISSLKAQETPTIKLTMTVMGLLTKVKTMA